MTYSFRNRIRIKDGKELQVDATEFRLSSETSNEHIMIQPGFLDKKLNEVTKGKKIMTLRFNGDELTAKQRRQFDNLVGINTQDMNDDQLATMIELFGMAVQKGHRHFGPGRK